MTCIDEMFDYRCLFLMADRPKELWDGTSVKSAAAAAAAAAAACATGSAHAKLPATAGDATGKIAPAAATSDFDDFSVFEAAFVKK